MLIVMKHGASPEEIEGVERTIEEMGYESEAIPGRQRTAVGLVGNDGRVDADRLQGMPGVREIIHVSRPYKQVSREWRPEDTVVELDNGARIGGEHRLCVGNGSAHVSQVQAHRGSRPLGGQGDRGVARGVRHLHGVGEVLFGALEEGGVGLDASPVDHSLGRDETPADDCDGRVGGLRGRTHRSPLPSASGPGRVPSYSPTGTIFWS
jgi:3-deoxy-7-phosphoheptulonate synthase